LSNNCGSWLTNLPSGEEFIVGDQAHIYTAEQGGSATIGGVHARVIQTNPDATLSLDKVEAAICPDDIHWPITKLVCIGTLQYFLFCTGP